MTVINSTYAQSVQTIVHRVLRQAVVVFVANTLRNVRRFRFLVAMFTCIAMLVAYSQLFGHDLLLLNPPNVPPYIANFFGMEGLTQWTFQGRVLDEDAEGLVITFGGLLDGHQTTVQDADGYFWYSVPLQQNGTVTAHTVDGEGQGSNYVTYVVRL